MNKKVQVIKKCNLKCNIKKRNFLLGFVIGLMLTIILPEDEIWNFESCPETVSPSSEYLDNFQPQLNLNNKPMAAKKAVKNIVRPRYYSSELGIREKLFIGVLTSQSNINTLATAFNKTVVHLVDKIKFFINADNVKSNFKLKNIVGFTDTRENLRPFHVLKYAADNYLNDFDYFLLVNDNVYLDARRLLKQLRHLSISFDMYMGQKMDGNRYCDLNSGIVLSSSAIKKIRGNLDWCVRNARSSDHSLNIGACVEYSTKLTGCQETFQGIEYKSSKINTYNIYHDLVMLSLDATFNNAFISHPVNTADGIYTLHTYFSRLNLELIKVASLQLEDQLRNVSNGSISNDILEIKWPYGVPESEYPETRHDIVAWNLLNLTHQFMPDHELNTKLLPPLESKDLTKILNHTLVFAKKRYDDLDYIRAHSIYRKFDAVRGMTYQLHLNFLTKHRKMVLKSFEIVKPLGRVEIIPSPYVTESTRVALLVPVFEHQIKDAIDFVNRYEKMCMESQDNTFLMLIFLYNVDSPNKGDQDLYSQLKKIALDLSEKYHSIVMTQCNDSTVMTSTYAKNEILSLVVTDLALRKIGLESLVMIGSVQMSFKADFLNRVRMNTVQSFQIFSPIGFMMYPCDFTKLCKECESCDVSQANGYFDKFNFDVLAFYSGDYVEARKLLESQVPIVRTDNDIELLTGRLDKSVKNILDMFVKSKISLHVLRAIEPNLRFGSTVKEHISKTKEAPMCPYWNTERADQCVHIFSRKQVGDSLVKYLSEKR